MTAIRLCLFFFACAASGSTSGSTGTADDYPAKPIQMIVPFPAGGPADIVGRLYAQHLSAVVGQPVVTLNERLAYSLELGGFIPRRAVRGPRPAVRQALMKGLSVRDAARAG